MGSFAIHIFLIYRLFIYSYIVLTFTVLERKENITKKILPLFSSILYTFY